MLRIFLSRVGKKRKGHCALAQGGRGRVGKTILDAKHTTQIVLPRRVMAAGQFNHNASYRTNGFVDGVSIASQKPFRLETKAQTSAPLRG